MCRSIQPESSLLRSVINKIDTMYTQCPKCLTYFQVTAEHLKVAQGNVRCGQCSNVFSALGNLSEIPPQEAGQSQTHSTESSGSSDKSRAKKTNTEAPSSAQSKLSNAIAAIQALNQSSQKILSQGRKNYVKQLQHTAKPTRKDKKAEQEKVKTTPAPESTEKPVKQEKAVAQQAKPTKQHDTEFDFEQALAAVDDIDIIDEELLAQETSAIETNDDIGNIDDITQILDDLPLTEEDLAQALESSKKPPAKQKPSAKRNLRKPSPVAENDISITELNLPPASEPVKTEPPKKQRLPLPRKQEQRQRAKAETAAKPQNRKNEKQAAKRPAPVKHHIVAEPEVIIENNIPTLAIPKQLLEDFQENQIHPAHYRSMITWGLLSLLLMIVFLGQAIYFKHNELGQVSQLRPYIEMFCRHASCELSMQTDIGMIELLGQDIRSHPKSKKALLVSATIINNAPFTQPFPGLRLSFSDMNGEKVASRNFMPLDYLPKNVARDKGMESNIPIQIELEIVDPGKNAVNFEFDFFPI